MGKKRGWEGNVYVCEVMILEFGRDSSRREGLNTEFLGLKMLLEISS